MTKPEVSVVVQTYNRQWLCERTIKQVRAALVGVEHDLIIADDGSNNGGCLNAGDITNVTLVANYDRATNAPGWTLNRAYELCETDYILHLEDDWAFVGKPEDFVKAIQEAREWLDDWGEFQQVRLRVPTCKGMLNFEEGLPRRLDSSGMLVLMGDDGTMNPYQYSGNPHLIAKSTWEECPFPESFPGVPRDQQMFKHENTMAREWRDRGWRYAHVLPGWFVHDDGGVTTHENV